MKRMYLYTTLLGGLLFLSCSGANEEVSRSTIHVADAMQNLQELKVSQLGNKIRYVPLETNDSVLVANHWNLLVTDQYAIISNMERGSSQKCMLFDLNTGKYITTIGHPGQDPEAYGASIPVLDEAGSEVLYFPKPKGIVKYSMDNRFLGSIKMERNLTSIPLIEDTVMSAVLSKDSPDGGRHISFLRMNLEGELIDSIVVAGSGKAVTTTPTLYTEAHIFVDPSLMPNSGVRYQKLKGRREDIGDVVVIKGPDQIWKSGGSVRFHQAFNDSIYGIGPEGYSVVYLFDTGKWHFPVEEAGRTEITPHHVFVTDITETEDKIVFAVSKGWFREDNKGYVGLYDKESGTTVMGEIEKGFQDDLAGFAPFYPVRTNSKGQLIGVMTLEEIDNWLEKHPDAERPAFFDTLAEDANPILVIVE